MREKAIYAGTFDPITLGHVDLVTRCSKLFGSVIVAVAKEAGKNTMFSAQQRADMVKAAMLGLANVEVVCFSGLLVDLAAERGVTVLVRGVRNHIDFEYEQQMAQANRQLAADIETVFLGPSGNCGHISSSMVREIAAAGGDVAEFVPSCVIPEVARIVESARKSE